MTLVPLVEPLATDNVAGDSVIVKPEAGWTSQESACETEGIVVLTRNAPFAKVGLKTISAP